MEKQVVIDLMTSSKSKEEWNENCDKVKAAHNGGYPEWWYVEIIESGLYSRVRMGWVGNLEKVSGELKIPGLSQEIRVTDLDDEF